MSAEYIKRFAALLIGGCVGLTSMALGQSPATAPATATNQPFYSSWPERTEGRGNLTVHVGPIRTILRAVRSALPVTFHDGTILVCGGSKFGAKEIRSEDWGETWRPQKFVLAELNNVELPDGRLLVMGFDPKPVENRPGYYQTQRWFSTDKAQSMTEAPNGATVHLPTDKFDEKQHHWFHGNLIPMGDKDVVSIMQVDTKIDGKATWETLFIRSHDQGETWEYVSMVADRAAIDLIRPQLQKDGWIAYGSVEPTIVSLGGGQLLCLSRTVNDESKIPEKQYGPASDTYHDLNYTVPGDGIHPSMTTLPADKFYTPGAPNGPLIMMRSTDTGEHWSAPEPMKQARGCFPRTAYDEPAGVLALTYGGLGTPRWGNCISFSTDQGKNWTNEINVGPFLTTGYTGLVSRGHGKFVVFFDCTPPQAWTNDLAWWIGAVDVDVTRANE